MKRWNAFSVLLISSLTMTASCGVGDGGGFKFEEVQTGVPVTMTLTATVGSSTSADLSWTAAQTEPSRYSVYANGTYLGPGYGTHESVPGLSPSTRYCFVVYAVYFPVGVMYSSNEACVTLPPDAPPSVPGGLSATAITAAAVQLTWNPSTDDYGPIQYHLLRGGTQLTVTASTDYADTTAVPLVRYCYSVLAVDGLGNRSRASAPACVTMPADTVRPSAPGNLRADANGTTMISLIWDPSTDDAAVAGYRIYRDGNLVATVTGTVFDDSGLVEHEGYCYAVNALDRAGNESDPGQVCAVTAWRAAIVDANGIPAAIRFGLDASASAHLAYARVDYNIATRTSEMQLRRASDASGTWQTSTVFTSPTNAITPQIGFAVDSVGVEHASFQDGGFTLRYASSATGWVLETMDPHINSGQQLSMAIDGAGHPHVAQYNGSGLSHVSGAPGAWVVTPIASRTGWYPSIGLDGTGNAHVSYYDFDSRTLRYATNASGAWQTESIDASVGVGMHNAIVVTEGGRAHVSYFDDANGDLKYATNTSGRWVVQTLDSAGKVGLETSIALDAKGGVHIAYRDGSRNAVKYATNASGTWRVYTLDGSRAESGGTAIAVDSTGRVRVAYRQGIALRHLSDR